MPENDSLMSLWFGLSLPIELVSSDGEGEIKSGKTESISSQGVFFLLDHELSIGTSVGYSIALPTGPLAFRSVWLCGVGRIVRHIGGLYLATLEHHNFLRATETNSLLRCPGMPGAAAEHRL